LGEVLTVFSNIATKYRQEYERIPVLIIDNADGLAQKHQRVLDLFQDYAERTADNGTASVVFMSSEGRVSRRMKRKLIMFAVICSLVIKC
jgi:hypothetical protein